MLAGGIIVSKWFVKMEGTMNEQNIALKLDDVEFRRRRRVILTKVNLEVKKGEKWVLFGPNGIGKSTLVQMMSTRGFPSEGTVDILGNRLGKVNVFSYRNRIGLSSAELGRAFPPQEDPLDAIVTALTATTGRWRDTYTDEDYAKARSLMREFGIEYLEGKMMFKLSEGERTRVLICRALMADPDLLILDEPTNHLDMKTKDILKQALMDFDGTLIVVSHDRDFLDGLVTKVYEFGNKKVTEHLEGIYEFLQRKKMENLNELERKN